MNFESLCQKLRQRPFFETPELPALFGKPEPAVLPRLSRWVTQGRLIQLRRGKYLLPPQFQTLPADPFYISNYLYRPSYVSLFSALQYYQLIPEAVFEIQAVTTRHTALWDTPLGQFRYYHTTPERFFGYTRVNIGTGTQQRALIAEPERTLIDICYFSAGEWTLPRWQELRLQHYSQIKPEQLTSYARLMKSPKVRRGVQHLLQWII